MDDAVLELAGKRIEAVLCGPGGEGEERDRVYLLFDDSTAVELELPREQGAGCAVPCSEQGLRDLAARRGGVSAERSVSADPPRTFQRPTPDRARAGAAASVRLVVAREDRPVTDKRDLVRTVGRTAHYIHRLLATPDGLNAAQEHSFDMEARRLGEVLQRRFVEHLHALVPLGLEEPEGCAAYLTLRDMDDLVRREDRAATLFFLDFVQGLVDECARSARTRRLSGLDA